MAQLLRAMCCNRKKTSKTFFPEEITIFQYQSLLILLTCIIIFICQSVSRWRISQYQVLIS